MSNLRSYMKGGLAGLMVALMSAGPAQAFSLTILHNNDGESDLLGNGDGFGGIDQFVQTVNDLRDGAMTDGVVTLSSGDNFLAGVETLAADSTGVNYDALALAAVDYDALIIGNHEFDFGPDFLASFIGDYQAAGGGAPFLSANLDFSGEAELQALVDTGAIAKSTIVDTAGELVGIVGATTPNLPFIASPGNVGVDQDLVATVQGEIDALEAEGINKIIFVSHLQGVADDQALIAELSGVDVAIAGGGDDLLANTDDLGEILPGDEPETDADGNLLGYPLSTADADGNDVPIITTSGAYDYVGKLVVEFDADGNLVSVIDDANQSGPKAVGGEGDPEIQANILEPLSAAIEEIETNVIADSDFALDVRSDTIRSVETGAGNLIADSFLWQAGQSEFLAEVGEVGVDLFDGNVVTITNGGGIRTDTLYDPGDITEGLTVDILPFPNFLSVFPEVEAETIKDVLENAVSRIVLDSEGTPQREGSGTGRFAQVAGLEFEYNPELTAIEIDLDGAITQEGERILNVKLADGTFLVKDGQVLPDAPSISVVTNSFTAGGGDQYPWGDTEFVNSSVTYQTALANYLTASTGDVGFNGLTGLDGLVVDPKYALDGEGRISLTDAEPVEPESVPEPSALLALLAVAGLGAGSRRKRQSA